MLRQLPYRRQHTGLSFLSLVGRFRVEVCPRHIRYRVQPDSVEALAARQAVALCQHYALEPAGERLRPAQLVEVAPGREERLLRGVLRQMKVAQHGVRARERQVLEPAHDLSKGVALLRACRPRGGSRGYQQPDVVQRWRSIPVLAQCFINKSQVDVKRLPRRGVRS